MAQELIYTSVPKGLKAGSDGYCTVAYTNGMPANIIKLLESFSDYSFLSLDDPDLESSPVSYRHYRHTIGTQTYNIISRVAFSGFDYTKRSNKLAHHIVLSAKERCPGGPAWLSQQQERPLFKTEWTGEPALIDHEKSVPKGAEDSAGDLNTWKQLAGDAGWAGKLAEQYLEKPDKPSYIVYNIENADKILSLIREAMLLLPEKKRWQVTYNTYFTVVRGAECIWRCCLEGDPILSKARGTKETLVIDLTSKLPEAVGGELVTAAREGKLGGKEAPAVVAAVEEEKSGGSIAIFEENKSKVMEIPKLSLDVLEEPAAAAEKTGSSEEEEVKDDKQDGISEKEKEPASGEVKTPEETLEKEKPSTGTDVLSANESAEKPEQSPAPPGPKSVPEKKSNSLLLIIVGGLIIILALGIIYSLLLKNTKNEAEVKNKQIEKGSPEETAKTTGIKDEKTEKKTDGKTDGKSAEMKKSSIGDEKKEDKNEVGKKTEKSEDKKDAAAIPKVADEDKEEALWLVYQRGIRKSAVDGFEMPIPDADAKAGFDLVFKEGFIENLKKSMACELIKKQNDSIMIFGEKQQGLKWEAIPFCEFRIKNEKEGLVVSVKQLTADYQPLDLKKDILALKFKDKIYPLVFGGEKELKAGLGKMKTDEVLDTFTVKFNYDFTEMDKLAGITSAKDSTDNFYEFIPRLAELKFEADPKVDSDRLSFEIKVHKEFPGIEQMYQDCSTLGQKELNKCANILIEYVKKEFPKYRNYNSKQILNNQILEFVKKEVLKKESADRKHDEGEVHQPFFKLDNMKTNAENALNKVAELPAKPPKLKKDIGSELERFIKEVDELKQQIQDKDLKTIKKDKAKLKIKKITLKQIQGKNLKDNVTVSFILDIIRDLNKFCGDIDVVEIKKELLKKKKTVAPENKIIVAIDNYQKLKKTPLPVIFKEYLESNPNKKALFDKEIEQLEKDFEIDVKRKSDGKKIKTISFKR